MDFRDIARANDMAEQLIKLKQWLKESWYAKTDDCRVAFGESLVYIPFAPTREAVKSEIDRITAELTKMGVDVKLPD